MFAVLSPPTVRNYYKLIVRQELQSNSTHLAVPGTEGFSVREAPKGGALTR